MKRLVGKQALELDFLKEVLKSIPRGGREEDYTSRQRACGSP